MRKTFNQEIDATRFCSMLEKVIREKVKGLQDQEVKSFGLAFDYTGVKAKEGKQVRLQIKDMGTFGASAYDYVVFRSIADIPTFIKSVKTYLSNLHIRGVFKIVQDTVYDNGLETDVVNGVTVLIAKPCSCYMHLQKYCKRHGISLVIPEKRGERYSYLPLHENVEKIIGNHKCGLIYDDDLFSQIESYLKECGLKDCKVYMLVGTDGTHVEVSFGEKYGRGEVKKYKYRNTYSDRRTYTIQKKGADLFLRGSVYPVVTDCIDSKYSYEELEYQGQYDNIDFKEVKNEAVDEAIVENVGKKPRKIFYGEDAEAIEIYVGVY